MQDFFISYTQADRKWAEWIAWTLEEAGHSCVIQVWDFKVGSNFVAEMDKAACNCQRTIAVLSKHYIESLFTQPEWMHAFSLDPTGNKSLLMPVRVAPCEPPGLLRNIVYCDLVGQDEETAKNTLLRAVENFTREKPSEPPVFPVSDITATTLPSTGPVAAAFRLLELVETTWATFKAQAKVRDTLVQMVENRTRVVLPLEFEQVLCRYYHSFEEGEFRLHWTIRSYTENVLYPKNCEMLSILEQSPVLLADVPVLVNLKHHLTLWVGKFKGIFKNDPNAALLYVGVEEGFPFPCGVDDALRWYIEKGNPSAIAEEDRIPSLPDAEHTNLDKWILTGRPHQWVRDHLESGWQHNDWLDLLDELRRSKSWPIEENQVGALLERIRASLQARQGEGRYSE